jgi:small-conductance mechanosensitive channel
MGKYPKLILEYFNEYFQQPLLFLLMVIVGLFALYKILGILFGKPSDRVAFRAISYSIEALGVFTILFASSWLVGFSKEVFPLLSVTIPVALLITGRKLVVGFVIGAIIKSRKVLQKGDIIVVDEITGKVGEMRSYSFDLITSLRHESSVSFFKLATSGFKNYSKEQVSKVVLNFKIPKNISEEELYQVIQDTIANEYYIAKFEAPQYKFGGDDNLATASVNFWSYQDFYWQIHHELQKKIEDRIFNLQKKKDHKLKIAR